MRLNAVSASRDLIEDDPEVAASSNEHRGRRAPARSRRRGGQTLSMFMLASTLLATSLGAGCTLLFGNDNDTNDATPLDPRNPTLPGRVSPEGNPEGEPSVAPEGEPGGSPGVSPGVEPESEPDALTIDLDNVGFEVTPDSGLYANLTDFATVSVTVQNLLGDPMEDLEVDLVVADTTSAVVAPSTTVRTGPDGIARFQVTSSSPGSVTVSASIVGVDGRVDTESASISFDLCVSNLSYYDLAVAGPVLTRCVGCHNAYGRLQDSAAMLDPDFAPDYGVIQGKMWFKFADDVNARAHNIEQLQAQTFTLGVAAMVPAGDERENVPYLLAKPMGLIPHGGGVVFDLDDPAIDVLTEEVFRLQNPDTCLEDPPFDLFDGVSHRTPGEVLARAEFALTGAVPSEDARQAVTN